MPLRLTGPVTWGRQGSRGADGEGAQTLGTSSSLRTGGAGLTCAPPASTRQALRVLLLARDTKPSHTSLLGVRVLGCEPPDRFWLPAPASPFVAGPGQWAFYKGPQTQSGGPSSLPGDPARPDRQKRSHRQGCTASRPRRTAVWRAAAGHQGPGWPRSCPGRSGSTARRGASTRRRPEPGRPHKALLGVEEVTGSAAPLCRPRNPGTPT